MNLMKLVIFLSFSMKQLRVFLWHHNLLYFGETQRFITLVVDFTGCSFVIHYCGKTISTVTAEDCKEPDFGFSLGPNLAAPPPTGLLKY